MICFTALFYGIFGCWKEEEERGEGARAMAARSNGSATVPIEFKVVPTEDLFLGGSLKRVPRVVKGFYNLL